MHALAVPIASRRRRDAEMAARKARRDAAKEAVWLRNGQVDRTRHRPMHGLDGHLLPPGKYPAWRELCRKWKKFMSYCSAECNSSVCQRQKAINQYAENGATTPDGPECRAKSPAGVRLPACGKFRNQSCRKHGRAV